MSEDKTPDEFVPEGSAHIETVFHAPDFEPDVPEVLTFRDLRDEDQDHDDDVADEPAVDAPVQPAPVATSAEPAAAESE